jgi:hypothetical protein
MLMLDPAFIGLAIVPVGGDGVPVKLSQLR